MKMRKLVSIILTLAMVCGMLPVMSFTAITAADAVLTSEYKMATTPQLKITTVNYYRHPDFLVRYDYGFHASVDYPANQYKFADHPQHKYYYGYQDSVKNFTASNSAGIEVAVNEFNLVTAIEDGKGNMAIPKNGFVLSAHGAMATNIRNLRDSGQLKVGTMMRTSDGSTYAFLTTNEDSQYTHPYDWLNIPRVTSATDDNDIVITMGGSNKRTGSNEWCNDVLIKATGTGEDGVANHSGYVVQFSGNNIEVPEGYFALTLPGQTVSDNGEPNLNASYVFENYARPGALVSIGTDNIYFRYDSASTLRGAYLMTGLTNTSIGVDKVYDYSAHTILEDAKKNFELVDVDAMQALYDNMVAVTYALDATDLPETATGASRDAIQVYHATINQNYKELCKLEFEKRPVEMRAVWIRPLPNDRVERTEAELDKLLEDEILKHKALGYNQIFVEAFYNSCTIFPVPSTAGHKDLYYSQNPYLVPTNMTTGSAGLYGLNSKLSEPYDMLQRFIEICRENDVEPHIWWEVFYVGYERTDPVTYPDSLFDYSVAKQIIDSYSAGDTTYQNWINQAHTGSYYYGAETDGAHQYFLSPASDNVQAFLLNTFKYVFGTYDVESFQLDYIRYPHTSAEKCFGYDAGTLWKFKQSSYYNESVHTDAYLKSYTGFYDEAWVQFRADIVTNFVKAVRIRMKEINPNMYLTSSPGADPADSKKNLMQDVEYWLENDLIDVLYPMAYGQNVPGMVAPGLVENNKDHFVCVGTSAGYDSDAYEQRWLKEVRDAGADGIAGFGTIDSWVSYAWSEPAITPTGDPANAACVYLEKVLLARAAQMKKLGAIDDTVYNSVSDAVEAATEAITTYGICDLKSLEAINALQTLANGLGANAKAAMTKDVDYLKKIRNNAGVYEVPDTLKNPVIAGDLSDITVAVAVDGLGRVEFNNVTLESGDAYALYASDTKATLKIELTGDNTFHFDEDKFTNLKAANVSYCGTGALYYGGELQFKMGDVTGDKAFDSDDLRDLLKYNVKKVEFEDEQLAISDANGDGKINTIDTRIFLDAYLG